MSTLWGRRSLRHATALAVIILVIAGGYDLYKMGRGCDSVTLHLWLRSSRYSRVHAGMTKGQVRRALGPPSEVKPNDHYTQWYYDIRPPIPTAVRGAEGTPLTADSASVFFGLSGRVTEVLPDGPSETDRIGPTRPVRQGMTKKQVLELAGKPDSIVDNRIVEEWRYPHWNGTRHAVTFDKAGRVVNVGVLYRRLTGVNDFSAVVETHR